MSVVAPAVAVAEASVPTLTGGSIEGGYGGGGSVTGGGGGGIGYFSSIGSGSGSGSGLEDLIVRVRERLTLCTPVAEDGNIVLPLRNSSSTMHIGDPVIAAAARASELAEIDPHMLCFCYCNSSDMELVRLTCCKQMIHRQCVLAYLCINSQCAYCKAMLEHAGVLELPTIDRLDLILPATMATTHQTPTTAGKKRDLQSLLLDKTPL